MAVFGWGWHFRLLLFLFLATSGCNGQVCDSGTKQSPIDIVYSSSDTPVTDVPPLDFTFNTDTTLLMENTGTAVKVTIEESNDPPPILVEGGGLEGTFQFAWIDFRWGSDSNNGSDHSFNGIQYDAEMQMIFFNTKYGCTLAEAEANGAGQADLYAGFAILFSNNGYKKNSAFEPIANGFKCVMTAETSAVVEIGSLGDIMPEEIDIFFKYEGSLTAEPCTESVTWFVIQDTVPLSIWQIESFYVVKDTSGNALTDVFRTVQDLNGRTVTYADSTYKLDPTCPTPLYVGKSLTWANFVFREVTKFTGVNSINDALRQCLNYNRQFTPVFGLITVGQLRYFNNVNYHNGASGALEITKFCYGPEFRVSAIKDDHGNWVEYMTGDPVQFHHFPKFDPNEGEIGDTLIWNAHYNKLVVVDATDKYPALCFYKDIDSNQRCQGCEVSRTCSDAGNCITTNCVCDTGFSGKYCQIPPLIERDLVFFGGEGNDGLEVFNTNSESTFKSTPSFLAEPFISNTIAEYIFDRAMICGGVDADGKQYKLCDLYDNSDKQWKPSSSLVEPIPTGAASVIVKDDGGQDKYWWVTHESASYRMDSNLIWSEFADWALEDARSGHCMVQLDCDNVAVIGGQVGGSDVGTTAIFNFRTSTWTDGPSITAQSGLACGKVTDLRGETYVVLGCGSTNDLQMWTLSNERVSNLAFDCSALSGDGHLGFKNIGTGQLGFVRTSAGSGETYYYTFNIEDGFSDPVVTTLATDYGNWIVTPPNIICDLPSDLEEQLEIKVLVVGGKPNSEGTLEVFDITEGDEKACSHWPDFTFFESTSALADLSGGLLANDVPFICTPVEKQCFTLYPDKPAEQTATTLETRTSSGVVLTRDKSALWITGGFTSGSEPFRTDSEIVAPGKVSIKGPDLPRSLAFHCLLMLDDDTAFFIAGSSSKDEFSMKLTYFYSFTTGLFTDGPELNDPRRDQSCGILVDRVSGEEIVVVTAGQLAGTTTYDTTEIYRASNPVWEYSDTIPASLEEGQMLTAPDRRSVVYMGGKIVGLGAQTAIYRFMCENAVCTWSTLSIALEIPRIDFVAFLIPGSLADCPTSSSPAIAGFVKSKPSGALEDEDPYDEIRVYTDAPPSKKNR